MHFSLMPFDIKGRVLDTSFIATDHKFLPDSLGLRAQTLKLRFADPEMKADFLTPRISFEELIPRLENIKHFMDSSTFSGRVFHRAFIGDPAGMIYSPVYIKNRAIYDAVLNRPIAKFTIIRADKFQSLDTRRDWKIKFISALCPNCGWDLTGERNSVVLFCKNCDMAWQVSRGGFKKLNFGVVPWREKKVVYIPFWRMKIKLEGLDPGSHADLIKIANLPGFWTPAFKVRPRVFLRMAKQLTIVQPAKDLRRTLAGLDLCPVTLNVSAALDSIKVILADIAVSRKKILPLLSGMDIKMKESLLVYLPFTVRGNEFIQTQMKFSIQRNAMRI